jgi:competence protein ComGC
MVERTPIARRLGDRAVRARRPRHRCARGVRSAFSLIELLVVISIAVLLTALMMPAMQQLRENAHRVMCMSNMQQLGHSFFLFGGDHNDGLPVSDALAQSNAPQNLMIARRPGVGEDKWDGLGRLYERQYCEAPECYYCPSHHGEHPYERYENMWRDSNPPTAIYTNYHYAGHMEWDQDNRKRTLLQGYELVLLTDGLRTQSDFNHVLGMNSLRGDGSVHWADDNGSIMAVLPKSAADPITPAYLSLWEMVQEQK